MLTGLKTLEAQWEKAPRKSKSEEKLIDFSEKKSFLYFSPDFLAEKIISSRVVSQYEESWQLGTKNLFILQEAHGKLGTKQKVCVCIIKIEWNGEKAIEAWKWLRKENIFLCWPEKRNSNWRIALTHVSPALISLGWSFRNGMQEIISLNTRCPCHALTYPDRVEHSPENA